MTEKHIFKAVLKTTFKSHGFIHIQDKYRLHFSHTPNFPKHLQHEFQAIPKCHEREAYEETVGATKFCHQGLKVVQEGLFFNHQVWRHVPQDKAKVAVGFLKECLHSLQ